MPYVTWLLLKYTEVDGNGTPSGSLPHACVPASSVTPQILPRTLSYANVASTPADPAGPQSQTDISTQALRKRVERLMKPKARGGLKVPPELIKEWETGDQNKLLDDFKKAGLDKDRLKKKCI